MSHHQMPPPIFKVGDTVHVTAPLNTSSLPTWVLKGQMYFRDATRDNVPGARAPGMNPNISVPNVGDRAPVGPEVVGNSSSIPGTEQTTNLQMPILPISMLLTEKLVPLDTHRPHLTNDVQFTSTRKVSEVILATGHALIEHSYVLVPERNMKAFVSESGLMGASCSIGSLVKKTSQQQGCWMVVGLTVRNGVVLADILDANGNIEIVETNQLRTVPTVDAMKALAG